MMDFNLIVSQGIAADKTAMTIKGASLTAKTIEKNYGVVAVSVGMPSISTKKHWTESLLQAKPTLQAVKGAVMTSVRSGKMTVLASNTCSISLATLPVVAQQFPDAALIWIDAHGDFNTPDTTDSGYLGGMVVAGACGLWDSGFGGGFNPEQVIFVGLRDIDLEEEKLIRQSGAQVIPPGEVTPAAILKAVNGRKVWIHIDWDVLEPGHVPADYKVSGGLLPGEVRAILEALPSEHVLGLELAEYKAPLDSDQSEVALATIIETVGPLLSRN